MQKNLTDTDNIRPITVSDTISNIFEKYLLIELNLKIKDEKQQLGFTKNSSTQHALFIMRETINVNKLNKKPTWIGGIDSSKAFDRVWRMGMFKKLIGQID